MSGLRQRVYCQAAVFLVACLVVTTASWADPAREWIPLNGPQGEEKTSIWVSGSDERAIDIQVIVPGLYREMVATPGGEFPRLSLFPDGFTAETGRPQLPVVARWVEIPTGAEARLEVVLAEAQVLSLADLGVAEDLVPVQAPVPKVLGAWEAARFEKDEAFYAQDLWYPSDVAQLGEVDQIRGHRLVFLLVHPLRYHPQKAEVSICTRLHLRIHLKGSDLEETQRRWKRWHSPDFEKSLSSSVLNCGRYLAKDVPVLPIGYLVIAHDNFYNQVLPLAQWKQEKGFVVTVTKLSQISPQTASGIKAYIQNAFNTWPVPPTYVLLVGDVGYIPTFTGSSSTTETDLPYADMEGSYFPELEVGRFSCSSTAEANAAVNKTLRYEKTNLAALSWFDDAVFMASLDQYKISEGTQNYVIDTYMTPNGYASYKIYQRLGGSTADITSNINSGRAIANYSGHGSQTAWAGPAFSIANIDALTNVDKYPFVISNACVTTDLGYSESFGEHWVNVTGKGAVAQWGSSNYTYWDEDDILERRMYQAIFEDELYTFAGFTDQAKWYTYQYYGGAGLSRYYYECYILVGDPSVELPTTVPASLTVTYPATVPLGTSLVTVAVQGGGSPLENALVCLLQEGVFQDVQYTSASGEAIFSVTTSATDTILVTASIHNWRPFQGGIVPMADVPPAAVSDLQSHLAKSALLLSWSAVTTDTLDNPKTVIGYVIYRDVLSDFLPSLANSLATTAQTEYVDVQAAVGDTAVDHYYKVVAKDDDGRKSEPSGPVGEFDRWMGNVSPDSLRSR